MATKKKTAARAQAIEWTEAEFGSGPFKGKFWGAKINDEFFMVVPRQARRGNGTYFQVWRQDIVHNEVKHPTLAAAQAFAEKLASKPKAA